MFAIIVHFNIQKLKNKHTFIQTEKAKSSHFDRTRGDKKQIFPTQEYLLLTVRFFFNKTSQNHWIKLTVRLLVGGEGGL